MNFIPHKDAVRTVIPALLLSFLCWKRLCCRCVDAIVKRMGQGVSACLEVKYCFIISENGPGHWEDTTTITTPVQYLCFCPGQQAVGVQGTDWTKTWSHLQTHIWFADKAIYKTCERATGRAEDCYPSQKPGPRLSRCDWNGLL